MMDLSNMMELCRLCLDRDRETISIFEGEGVDRNICEKIGSCLPVKVSRDDPLPKKICDDCTNKVELVYSFWNTTSSAEKQLLEWLGLNDTDSEAPAEMLKTEMVLFKEESDENDMIAELTHMANSGLADDSQCIIENEPDAAEDSDDEESEGEESHGEEGQAEEDPGGGVSEQPKLPSINLSSMVSAVAGALNSSIEAGPSGLQLPETTSSQPAPQPPVLPQQTPDLQSIVGLDSPRYRISNENGEESGDPSSSVTEACEVCGKRFPASYMRLHMWNHSGKKPFNCPVCDAAFPNYKGLRSHMVSHSDYRPFSCGVCPRAFKRNHELSQHTKIHSGEKAYHCDICNYSCIQKSNLIIHKKRHSNDYRFMCDLCDKGCYTTQELHKHKMNHLDIVYKCKLCDKEFHHKYGLTIHEKKHDPNYEPPVGTFQCDHCGKRYLREGGLKVHMRKHTGVRPYTCEVCGKSVSSRGILEVHIRTHTGEKPIICEVCGKAFGSKRYLDTHMRCHTGERPFQCKECGKCFTQQSSLKVHTRYHTGERPFRCPICNKGFVIRAQLNSHKKSANHFLQESPSESEEGGDSLFLHDAEMSESDPSVISNEDVCYSDLQLSETIIYTCPNCKEIFVDEKQLLNHVCKLGNNKETSDTLQQQSDSE